MTSNNLNSAFEDCFDSSTLNHKSPKPSPNPSLKPYPKHNSSPIHQSKPMVESPNSTDIIQILEKPMNLDDSEHPASESTDD